MFKMYQIKNQTHVEFEISLLCFFLETKQLFFTLREGSWKVECNADTHVIHLLGFKYELETFILNVYYSFCVGCKDRNPNAQCVWNSQNVSEVTVWRNSNTGGMFLSSTASLKVIQIMWLFVLSTCTFSPLFNTIIRNIQKHPS